MPDKETFSTGAQRDTQTSKLRYDLIPIGALEALAKVYTDGAVKYGDNNWQKGMPFKRVYASLLRHVFAWAAGDTTERHMANAAWNCFALLHYEDMVELGVLPPELDDRVKSVALSDFHPEMLPTGDENLITACEDYAGEPVIAFTMNPDGIEAMRKYLADLDALSYEAMQPEEWGDLVDCVEEDVIDEVTPDDERRARHYGQLVNMGCSPYVAAQVVGGMTFSKNLQSKTMPWAYIAGPMRGYPEFNFPAFDAARDELLEVGYDVISPADIDRTAGDTNNGDQCRFALRDFWSMYFIKTNEKGSAIFLLKGWEKSIGATAEKALADWMGLGVRYYV